jgi:hypothetical protein
VHYGRDVLAVPQRRRCKSPLDSVVSRDVLEEEYMLMTFRYGVDGSWSAITIGVGTEDPRQWMDVMVSMVSSET